jgi:peroxiredoxin-like protein
MSTIHFHLQAKWSGGRNGEGYIESGNLATRVSAPKELDGPGIGTNPEEMLIGAAATCYIITLAAVLEKRELPLVELTLKSEGVLSKEGGLHFTKLIHRPHIVLRQGTTEEQIKTAQLATERAEHACMISKALRGNVEISVEPTITLA